MRRFVVGDIHGCFNSLLDLMNKLPLESSDKLIFLGDYIDRGPYSKQVVDYVKRMTDAKQAIALMGNHEKMCVDAYNSGYWGQVWMQNGSGATIDSYDTRTDEEKKKPSMALEMDAYHKWKEKLPKVSDEHIEWMKTLPLYYEDDEFFYVHAGVLPGETLAEQDEEDLLWIRSQFIKHTELFEKRIVFGHTPFEKVQVLQNKIGVDTGCVYDNKLSAICLDTMEIISVGKHSKDVLHS